MITIQIKNAKEVVENKKGRFISEFGDKFLDLESRVEKGLIEQLNISLSEQGIEAEIRQVKE